MKTKELIRQLQEADPTGEVEVSVGNIDIHYIESQPAYWDGKQQVLIRDETNPYYNIIGAKIRSQGLKVVIRPLSISEALWEDENLPIDYSDLSPENVERYKASHDSVRMRGKNCRDKHELEHFTKYIREKAVAITDDLEDVEEVAHAYFDEHLDSNDEIPKDIPIIGESYNSRREKQWDRQIEVTYDGEIQITAKSI